MAITYRGETFSGYNKPKRTSKHPRSSHAVLAKEGDQVKKDKKVLRQEWVNI